MITSGSGVTAEGGVGMTGLWVTMGEAAGETAVEDTGEVKRETAVEVAGEVRDAGSAIESGSGDTRYSNVSGVRGLECKPVREVDLDAGFAGVRGRDSRPTRDADLDVDGGGTIGM